MEYNPILQKILELEKTLSDLKKIVVSSNIDVPKPQIYRLEFEDGYFYIGETTMSLKDRKRNHKSHCRQKNRDSPVNVKIRSGENFEIYHICDAPNDKVEREKLEASIIQDEYNEFCLNVKCVQSDEEKKRIQEEEDRVKELKRLEKEEEKKRVEEEEDRVKELKRLEKKEEKKRIEEEEDRVKELNKLKKKEEKKRIQEEGYRLKELKRLEKEQKKLELLKSWYCELCDMQCRTTVEWTAHNNTRKHKVQIGEVKKHEEYHCEKCDYHTKIKHHFEQHCNTQKHQKG